MTYLCIVSKNRRVLHHGNYPRSDILAMIELGLNSPCSRNSAPATKGGTSAVPSLVRTIGCDLGLLDRHN